jgi:hypothetical protein
MSCTRSWIVCLIYYHIPLPSTPRPTNLTLLNAHLPFSLSSDGYLSMLCRCLGRDVASYRLGGWASCGPHAHFTCGNYDTTYHDLCGYYLGANPDGYVNEEWFGLTVNISNTHPITVFVEL